MLKDMVGTRDDLGPGDQGPSSNTSKWSSNFMEEIESFSSGSHKEINKETHRNSEQDMLSPQTASQVFWCTGMYSEPIPNGFYSVIPDKKLKEQFDNIPALDELRALEIEGFRADVILVESDQDKKLSMLKQLTSSLVKGLNSNPATMIKKIAALVCDFYKGPISESPSKSVAEETSNTFEDHRVQLLGQIKHGSCRPRAILFKVLADTVGLESQLVVGLPMPNDGGAEFLEPYRHVSVIVVLNSVELLVDLIRFPGQLLPPSTKAVFMTHVSATGESDSAENDSCDSPLEPNSPLHGFSERVDLDSTERDDILQFHRKNEASSNASLRHAMMRWATVVDRELSSSHSEPNIATAFWRRSRRKVIADQRTASISPEHPLFRARGRSMLSGDRKDFRDFSDDTSTSRSTGASTSESRLMRRRSISIPEIGDDIVRAVRAMNDKMKQNRISRERGDDVNGNRSSDIQKNDQLGWQRAVSLPSSPHEYRGENSKRGGPSEYTVNDDLVSAWNKVLDSYGLNNKPLLPYQEWNIDFAELTVGIRIGIGFFGEVFRGVWNGTDVAIKVFLEQDLTTENMEDFCNEISILSRLRHPNVILFLGACTKPPLLSMVTEYMEMGSLYSLIHLSGYKKKLSWRRRLKMLRDICRGLMCIHRMKIVHRDLKSANCLVNKHWMVKICDFGLSRILTGERTAMMDSPSAGTSEWMAPELFRNEPLTEKCDIFSLGVIMWELCTLNRPWEGVPPEKVIYAVSTEGLRLEIPEGPLSQLISDCWAEPLERPSCEEILSRLIDCEFSLC